MCKTLFNKNQNYKATEIAQAVYDITPGRYANVDSAIAAVNIFIRKNGITPVNGQRQNKVYPDLTVRRSWITSLLQGSSWRSRSPNLQRILQ